MDESSKEIHSEGQFESLVNEFSEICQDNNVLPNEEVPIKEDKSEFSNQFDIKHQAYEMRHTDEESFKTTFDEDNESEDRKSGVIYASFEELTGVRLVCKKLTAYDIWRINSELSVSAHQCEICGEIFASNRALKRHNEYPCIDDDKPSLYECNPMSVVLKEGVDGESIRGSDRNLLNYTQRGNRNENSVNLIQNADHDEYFDDSAGSDDLNENNFVNSLNANQNENLNIFAGRTYPSRSVVHFSHWDGNFNSSTRSANQNDSLPNFNGNPNGNTNLIDFTRSANKAGPFSDKAPNLLCHKCEIYDKTFSLLSNLKFRIVSTRNKGLQKCQRCDSPFPSTAMRSQHSDFHPPNFRIKTRKCALCDMSFCDYSDLAIHSAKVHFSSSRKCGICEIRFENNNSLNHHKMLFHNGQSVENCFGKNSIRKKYENSQKLRIKPLKKSTISFKYISNAKKCKSSFFCYLCQTVFFNKKKLIEHISHWHEGKETFSRPLEESFSQSDRSIKSINTGKSPVERPLPFRQAKTFLCHFCNTSFSKKTLLSAHIFQMHLKEDSAIDSQYEHLSDSPCGNLENFVNLFPTDAPLEKKISSIASSQKNTISRRSYQNVEVLRGYLARNKEGIGQNSCPKSNVAGSEVEVRCDGTVRKLYKCSRCDNLYSNWILLNEHRDTHKPEEEEKMEKCDVCSARFYTLDELKTHANEVHFPFNCELCEKSFARENNLKLHQKLLHKLPSGAHKCDECKSVFRSRTHLLSHRRTWKCKQCEKCSKMPNVVCPNHGFNLCSHCKKSFRSPSSLRIHTISHALKKCRICGEKFIETKKLYEHVREHRKKAATLRREERKRQTTSMILEKNMEREKKKIDALVQPIIKRGEKINDNVPTCIVTIASLGRSFFKCQVCGNLYSSATLLNAHTATHPPQLET